MKKEYVIKEMVQTFEDGTPLYYKGFTTSGSWDKYSFALAYETRQEAECKAADLLSHEGGDLTIIEILTN
jgi:hypothetical protein